MRRLVFVAWASARAPPGTLGDRSQPNGCQTSIFPGRNRQKTDASDPDMVRVRNDFSLKRSQIFGGRSSRKAIVVSTKGSERRARKETGTGADNAMSAIHPHRS